jgi:SAM-dependent methyltransferase
VTTDRSEQVRLTVDAYSVAAQNFADKPDDRAWLQPLVAMFAEALPPGALVADLGCASGRETVELRAAGLQVVGLDLTRAFLAIARERYPALGYVQGDLRSLPFATGAFDGAWASASLLHLSRDEVPGALAEVHRILRPGGAFYSSMQWGEAAGMVAPLEGDVVSGARYYTYYEPEEWRGMVEAAGFTVERLNAKEMPYGCNRGAHGWVEALGRR